MRSIGVQAKARTRSRRFFRTARKKQIMSNVQDCPKCGKHSLRLTIIKDDDPKETLRIWHCHTCGLHDEFKPRWLCQQSPDDYCQLVDRMNRMELAKQPLQEIEAIENA